MKRRPLALLLLAALPVTGVVAANRTWNNTGTDFNAAGSWTGGIPGTGDRAVFSTAAATNPNLSTSLTIQGLGFSTTASSGYTLSATPGESLTLTNTGSTSTTSALSSLNTSGTNTISAPLILGQAEATTVTFTQSLGGVLEIGGNISSTNAISGLSLGLTGTYTLSGNNSYSGTTALGNASTLRINSSTAISAGALLLSGTNTLGNTSGAKVTLTHNNNLTLAGTTNFTSTADTGDLSFGTGTIMLAGAGTLLVTNSGSTLTIGSLDADTTARTLTVGSITTAGKLVVSNAAGANLQGNINFAGGIVEIGNKSALGTGTIVWQPDNSSVGTKTLLASTDLTGANAVATNMTLGTNGNSIGPSIIGGTHAIEFSGTLATVGNSRTFTINNTALTTFSGDVKLAPAFTFFLTLNGSGNVLISGAISQNTGTGSAGLTYAGTGTLTLSGTNTYAAATTVSSGTLQLAKQTSLYNDTTASWTAANIRVASGGTLALNVGGAGEFTTDDVTTLLTNLAASTNATTNGMAAGSTLGFDTTNASGGTFTVANVIANTTGAAGGARGLTKLGTGTLELSNANTYTGATTVANGTLAVTGSGSINATGRIAVSASGAKLRYDSSTGLTSDVTLANGGTFAYNSSANYSGALTFTNGKLAGTNWNGSSLGGLTIGANQTVSPGNSPGTATTTSQTWAGGGTYDWEINNVAGTAGTNWDLINFSTGLAITATSESKFTLNVLSLTMANVAGSVTGFDSTSNYKWLIADSAAAITSFSANFFAINTAGFTNPHTGSFALSLGDASGIGGDNSQLWLTYTAASLVPEPSSAALIAGGLSLLMIASRRRRHA